MALLLSWRTWTVPNMSKSFTWAVASSGVSIDQSSKGRGMSSHADCVHFWRQFNLVHHMHGCTGIDRPLTLSLVWSDGRCRYHIYSIYRLKNVASFSRYVSTTSSAHNVFFGSLPANGRVRVSIMFLSSLG